MTLAHMFRSQRENCAAAQGVAVAERLLPPAPDPTEFARGYATRAADERRKGWMKQPDRNE